MGTKEDNTTKPSKSSASTQEVPTVQPSYPDWSSSIQAYYNPGVAPPPYYATTVASPAPHPYMWGGQHPLMAQYGTPVPYPAAAMYPPGNMYAHPSMVMTPSAMHQTTEFEGKGPDGKDKDSSRKPKGTSANACANVGENVKDGSGSGNDGFSGSGESGSEGSSNGSDENNNQQESARNKKGGFDLMLVDGANTQNNTAGPITQSPVPGNPVVSMPATNLNIGMDLWNPSNASADAAKMRHNQSGVPGAVAVGEPWMQADRELKRQKRKQSNRESARRSRLRKQAECEELQKRVEALGSENQALKEELQKLSEDCEKFTSENDSIKEELERLCGPEVVANLE